MFSLKDYTFELPEDQIAETAVHPAHNARLMVIDRKWHVPVEHTSFWDIDKHLPKDRVLFFNDSKVLRARMPLTQTRISDVHGNIHIISDGEIFFLHANTSHVFEALVRPGKKLKPGTVIHLQDATIKIESLTESGRICSIHGMSIYDYMNLHGQLPLPPYITYQKEKESDYQTVFAKKEGSVAAPTASLHFTDALLQKLPHERHMLTLHVWLGTFRSIDTDDIRNYKIHKEYTEIDPLLFSIIAEIKTSGKKIVATGTTACRALESLPVLWHHMSSDIKNSIDPHIQAFWDAIPIENTNIVEVVWENAHSIQFSTRIYIIPWHTFTIVDELITNFHLPESSLLVLVSALIWQSSLIQYYQEAIQDGYRFFSFWDGMYIRNYSDFS